MQELVLTLLLTIFGVALTITILAMLITYMIYSWIVKAIHKYNKINITYQLTEEK